MAGEVDILLHNAGGDIRKNRWLHQTADDWHVTHELNVVTGFVSLSEHPSMIRRGWGRIITVSSIYGSLGQNRLYTQQDKDAGAYIVAKHDVIGMTRFLAGRLAEHGITANSISPGMFPLKPDDPILAKQPWKQPFPAMRERFGEVTPLKRVGGKRDLSAAALFLASLTASFVTDQDRVVDGGWSIW